MLEIKNIHARIDDKDILNGINLSINPGEVHAIMGPNGSGKSTLASVITGKEDYEITKGEILFEKSAEVGLFCGPISENRLRLFRKFQKATQNPDLGVRTMHFQLCAPKNNCVIDPIIWLNNYGLSWRLGAGFQTSL